MKLILAIGTMLLSFSVIVGQTIQKNEVGYDKLSLSIPKTPSYLNIPERLSNATEATDFVRQVTNLSVEDREKAIVNEIVSGNVPSFARVLKPIKVVEVIEGKRNELIFFYA
jgi:hypothetical protein